MTDEDLIRELQRQWFLATRSGDLHGIEDLMTDDVTFLTAGRAPFGKREFIDSFDSMKQQISLKCEGEYTEIIVHGDFAYATARLEIFISPKKGGATKRLSGNTLSVFKRLPDGKWRLFRDANLLVGSA